MAFYLIEWSLFVIQWSWIIWIALTAYRLNTGNKWQSAGMAIFYAGIAWGLSEAVIEIIMAQTLNLMY
jgi:hypothetical protein